MGESVPSLMPQLERCEGVVAFGCVPLCNLPPPLGRYLGEDRVERTRRHGAILAAPSYNFARAAFLCEALQPNRFWGILLSRRRLHLIDNRHSDRRCQRPPNLPPGGRCDSRSLAGLSVALVSLTGLRDGLRVFGGDQRRGTSNVDDLLERGATVAVQTVYWCRRR
jgi:hypothetical protein